MTDASTDSPVTNCTECPFYVKAAEARESMGLPYFGMCGASGRFITSAAAANLPGSTMCPKVYKSDPELLTEGELRERAFEQVMVEVPTKLEAKAHIGKALKMVIYEDVEPRTESPDSCKRCIFFQTRELGIAGTPTGRYDFCQRLGSLIKPGSRASTAERCSVGVKGAPTAMSPKLPLLRIYTDSTLAKPVEMKPMRPIRLPGPLPVVDVDDTIIAASLEPGATGRVPSVEWLAIAPVGTKIWRDPDYKYTKVTSSEAESVGEPASHVWCIRKTAPAGYYASDSWSGLVGGEGPDIWNFELPAGHVTSVADDLTFLAPTSPEKDGDAVALAPLPTTPDAAITDITDAAFSDVDALAAATLERLAKESALASLTADVAAEIMGDTETLHAAPGDASTGLKSLPVRVNRTGIVCMADTYTMPYDLPQGAVGVVSVRSTSKGSNYIWLPRFDENAHSEFSEDIPAEDENAYFDHSDLMYRMAVAYMTDSVCALWGDAGVGKTEAVEHLARLTRQPFARISIKWATQVDDLIGRWTLRDGSMEWLDGRFTKAWRLPYIVCVDEPNTGKDEVWQALRAPFDGARQLVLDEKDGERIPRNPLARVFTAMNPSWDARFAGTRPLNDADLDRMQHIMVPYPPQDVEQRIIIAKAPASVTADPDTVQAILNAARDIRAAVKAKTIRVSFGLRKVLRWADAMQYMTPLNAFDQAVTNWMEPGEARALRDIADAYFKS